MAGSHKVAERNETGNQGGETKRGNETLPRAEKRNDSEGAKRLSFLWAGAALTGQ